MGGGLKKHDAQVRPVTNRAQAAVALLVLVVGTLVYVLDRPAEQLPLVGIINLSEVLPALFGPVGHSLPTFTHVFAFSLLTAAWFGGGQRVGLTACLVWFGVDSAFEVGQHPQIAERLVQFMPGWFGQLPVLHQTDSFFSSGTFDPGDLISIALGAAVAYLLIRRTAPKDDRRG